MEPCFRGSRIFYGRYGVAVAWTAWLRRRKMSEEALATARGYEINKVAKQAVVGYESAIEVWWNN